MGKILELKKSDFYKSYDFCKFFKGGPGRGAGKGGQDTDGMAADDTTMMSSLELCDGKCHRTTKHRPMQSF